MQFDQLGRREFITLLGGAACVAARRARATGSGFGASACSCDLRPTIRKDRPAWPRSCRAATFGWNDGRNVRIDIRWCAGDVDPFGRYATDLAALAPDVILAGAGTATPALLQATRTVPIVFVPAADPVGAGFVDSLARPGGNATGFLAFDYSLSAKWLELLKEITPRSSE